MSIRSELILPWQKDLPEGKLENKNILYDVQDDLLTKKMTKVLLVDDSMRAITSLNKIFTDLGCNTLVSFDGHAAINSLLQTNVDLIVLDMMMEGLDGKATLEKADEIFCRMKEEEEKNFEIMQAEIPVVIYSGLGRTEINVRSTENFRLMDIWQKPTSFSRLSVRAKDLLQEIKI